MGPLDAIKTCLAKSFQFKGRASRAEFWWFAGTVAIVTFMALLPHASILSSTTSDYLITKTSAFTGQTETVLERRVEWHVYKVAWNPMSFAIVATFYVLISAVTSRRLHDVGSSAWFGVSMLLIGPISAVFAWVMTLLIWQLSPGLAVLTGFILVLLSWLAWLVCPAILIILLTRPSEEGQTEYGPNPNEVPK